MLDANSQYNRRQYKLASLGIDDAEFDKRLITKLSYLQLMYIHVL